MGRHLEAHRARYLASGDFPTFALGFDAALRADAIAARPLSAFVLLPPGPITLTPEELLAALEPPTPATLALSPSQQLRASQNQLADWWREHDGGIVELVVIALLVLVILLLPFR